MDLRSSVLRQFRDTMPKKFCAAAAVLLLSTACSAPSSPDRVNELSGPSVELAAQVENEPAPAEDVSLAAPAGSGFDASVICETGRDRVLEALSSCPAPGAAGASDPITDTFSFSDVRHKARLLAEQAYRAAPELPKDAAALDYDQYRRIEFKSTSTIWPGDDTGFRVLLDPRGYLFTHNVGINLIAAGKVARRPYAASDLEFWDLPLADEVKKSLGYAGFRVLNPLNQPGKYDELVSFKGASFFRALGAGTVYGASARGLSIGTASTGGEEFPYFTEFWLAEPKPGDAQIILYALLDGESVTGAFEFTITPGPETLVDVSATFFPRRELSAVGISPLTSMYFFSPHDLKKQADDYRPAVHDSEGLAIWMQNGEWVWRPLINPQSLQVSVLASSVPRGFGLIQRKRDLSSYSDVEANYHSRPNVWVEPTTDWGAGQLSLVEIPTANEYNDNVVVFWKPAAPWQPGRAYDFSYRMHWSLFQPPAAAVLPIAETRVGKTPDKKRQLFVIDYEAKQEALLKNAEASISTSAGKILHPTLTHHPETGNTRLTFELSTENDEVAELRALLTRGGKPVTETWLYRWRPE
jgi:glucans biosynthesis protein